MAQADKYGSVDMRRTCLDFVLLICPGEFVGLSTHGNPEGQEEHKENGRLLESDFHCWKGDFTFSLCCDPAFGDRGNFRCWDEVFTFERCCVRKSLLLEVGAYDGRDSLMYYMNGYRVITFEPKRDLFEALEAKTRDLSDYNAYNYAISDLDGEVDFHISKEYGASSILQFKDSDDLIKNWGEHRWDVHYSGTSYTVQSMRLQTFIETNNLVDQEIDFLHVDAQGVDLKVLQSLGPYIANVRSGVIEAAHSLDKTIYKGQTSTVQVCKQWLELNGFRIEKVEHNGMQGAPDLELEYNIFFKRN